MNTSKTRKGKTKKRTCPYCEGQIMDAKLPYCKPCDVMLLYCTRCGIAVKREANACPQCGGELKWK